MQLDNRGLQPPQPMIRTLEKLEELTSGEKLMIINDRRPMFLFQELDEQGIHYECEAQSDGSYIITIYK
ncbi:MULTISPECIES: DUF2249 domain-containing protein [Gracilibacillus]|uniref:DUF2249 domain-containing protein n=1 Tax=Gracilibacillus dipsosauri TaxID=178340 RepID=A0A317KWX5_9BACI|nr:DUF2249 domain-containing protein [Gracilibacillus dipsosauri]PWU67796.1 DUF2249 domain-containing protein [Gracilibacillus dipsosauri]